MSALGEKYEITPQLLRNGQNLPFLKSHCSKMGGWERDKIEILCCGGWERDKAIFT